MKFNQFTKIVGRIQHDIPCPKCKAIFKSETIEVVNLHDNKLQLAAECPNCAEKVSISASLEKSFKFPLTEATGKSENKKEKTLSSKDVSNISESLKSFRGDDVRRLFE